MKPSSYDATSLARRRPYRRNSARSIASLAALLLAGSNVCNARNLRRGSAPSRDADSPSALGDDEVGFEVVSSNDSVDYWMTVEDGDGGFEGETVGESVEHFPFTEEDTRQRNAAMEWRRLALEEELSPPPKEHVNDETLQFIDPEDSEHERIERSCKSDEKLWIFTFRTDAYGYETSWSLEKRDDDGNWAPLASGPRGRSKYRDNTTYRGASCLPGGIMYKLTVFDAYKDGFCCNYGEGWYNYKVDGITEYDTNKQRTFLDKGEHSFFVGKPVNKEEETEGTPFTSRGNGKCGSNKQLITIKFKADKYGAENSWSLVHENGKVYASKGLKSYGKFTEDEVSVCCPYGNYKFTITDGVGDGICCREGKGRYELYIDGDLMVYGSDFTTGKRREHDIIVGYHEQYDQMTTREAQYLDCHNWRREKYHTMYNATYVPLKYDFNLQADAQNWANELLNDCAVRGIEHEPGVEQGENLAKNTGNGKWGQLYPVENICRRWFEREEDWPYPQNAHFTQGNWRSAKYVGCAESEKEMDNGGMCRIQVCRYARAGNCAMGRYKANIGKNYITPMLMDENPCGPACPHNVCH